MQKRTFFFLCGQLTVRITFDHIDKAGIRHLVVVEVTPRHAARNGLRFTGHVMFVANENEPNLNLCEGRSAKELSLCFSTSSDLGDQRFKLRRAFKRLKLV